MHSYGGRLRDARLAVGCREPDEQVILPQRALEPEQAKDDLSCERCEQAGATDPCGLSEATGEAR
jgi:hypothetical protein